MRSTFVAALSFASAHAWSTEVYAYRMEHADMFKVVEGILMGAIELSIPSAETCISDVDKLTSEVEEAVTDFKKMSFSGVKAGINMIGTIAGEVQGDIADCKVSAEDA